MFGRTSSHVSCNFATGSQRDKSGKNNTRLEKLHVYKDGSDTVHACYIRLLINYSSVVQGPCLYVWGMGNILSKVNIFFLSYAKLRQQKARTSTVPTTPPGNGVAMPRMANCLRIPPAQLATSGLCSASCAKLTLTRDNGLRKAKLTVIL